MTDKQCCGTCHWGRATGLNFVICQRPIPDAAVMEFSMPSLEGETCPTFRQRGERLPQRFRVWIASNWSYGVCWPMTNGYWSMQMLSAHGTFINDPTELIVTLFGDANFEWIDRDYEWNGSR